MMGATPFGKDGYGNFAAGGDDENKANHNQFYAPSTTKGGAGKGETSISEAAG